jgi:putative NADH-flavin reductase
LAAGHTVTAIARRPSAIALRHERLVVVAGDVLEPATLAQPMLGQDAVVSVIGVATREPTQLYSAGVANIMQAMQTAGVRRLICISASGLDPGPRIQRWFAKPLLWRLLRNMYTDLLRMEAEIKRSDLNWTIIRPPMLTHKPRTGRYQVVVNEQFLHGGWTISRADVADYIVNHLDDSVLSRAMVEVAY